MIAEDSFEFKNFLENKREIAEIKQNFSGEWVKESSEIINTSSKQISQDIYEVTANIGYHFYSGKDKSYMEEQYKVIVVKNDEDIEVLSGICNGLSAGTLIPENITCLEEELKVIDWESGLITKKLSMDTRYNNTINYFSHDYNQIKENLLKWYDEEITSVDCEVDEEDIILLKSANWNYFSNSEKSAMTEYQEKHYNNYNSNYADFSEYGGDCTNYASQILRAGGSAFNQSNNSGIMGDRYWYYRSSNNRSTSWTAAKNLKNFLLRNENTLGPKATTVTRFRDLDVGSIIFLTSGGTPYHSVIVAEEGGDPMVSAHTSNYYGRYSNRYSGISHIKAYVRGYYE